MIFIQDLTKKTLNSYNNNIIEYKASDSNKFAKKSTLSIQGSIYELTPNTTGVFRFNFINIAKVLNQNNFKDEINPDLKKLHCVYDASLSKEITVVIKIIFSDNSEETQEKKYNFLKSVEQIIRTRINVDERLFPLVNNRSKVSYLTYFEGYPYDIPFYCEKTAKVKILNKKIQKEIFIDAKKGVNRLFIADGQSNVSLEKIMPLYVGINELEFIINNEVLFTIFLKKVDATCGVYLKWFNQSGAYSYWLFPGETRIDLKTKTLKNLNVNYNNLSNSQGNFLVTGKSAQKKLKMLSQPISDMEFDYLQEIFTSPKVELLNAERYLLSNSNDWINVRVIDGNIVLKSKDLQQQIPIIIELPTLYTQSL